MEMTFPCLIRRGFRSMRFSTRWAGILLAIVALPAWAADGAKDAKKKKAKPKTPKLAYGAAFVGKVTIISPNSQKEFTVQLNHGYLAPNAQAYVNLLRTQQNVA